MTSANYTYGQQVQFTKTDRLTCARVNFGRSDSGTPRSSKFASVTLASGKVASASGTPVGSNFGPITNLLPSRIPVKGFLGVLPADLSRDTFSGMIGGKGGTNRGRAFPLLSSAVIFGAPKLSDPSSERSAARFFWRYSEASLAFTSAVVKALSSILGAAPGETSSFLSSLEFGLELELDLRLCLFLISLIYKIMSI